MKAKPTRLGDSPKIYLRTIWCSKTLSNIMNFLLFLISLLFVYWFWLLLCQFRYFLEVLEKDNQNGGSKMATVLDHVKILMSCDIVSSCCGPQRNIFGHTICPLSFVVIALIFSILLFDILDCRLLPPLEYSLLYMKCLKLHYKHTLRTYKK